MVKIKREWEVSDIDWDNDPIHMFLRSLTAFVLLDVLLIHRDKLTRASDADREEIFKEVVCSLLNMVENDDRIEIVVKEQSAEQRGIPRRKVDCACPGAEFGGHDIDCKHREARPFA